MVNLYIILFLLTLMGGILTAYNYTSLLLTCEECQFDSYFFLIFLSLIVISLLIYSFAKRLRWGWYLAILLLVTGFVTYLDFVFKTISSIQEYELTRNELWNDEFFASGIKRALVLLILSAGLCLQRVRHEFQVALKSMYSTIGISIVFDSLWVYYLI